MVGLQAVIGFTTTAPEILNTDLPTVLDECARHALAVLAVSVAFQAMADDY